MIFAEVDGGPGRQRFLDLPEHRAQAVIERRPLVLRQQLFGQVDREQVALLDRDGRQLVVRLGVPIPPMFRRIPDWRVEAIAHVIEVALDGLDADLVIAGQLGAVGVAALGDLPVTDQDN